MDRLAINHTLRNWAFAATTAHTNLIYDITLLGLVSQLAHFIGLGGVGPCGAQRADGTASSTP